MAVHLGRFRYLPRNLLARPGQNTQRHALHDILPVLPAVQLCQVVSPHQPQEMNPRIKPLHVPQRIGGKARLQMPLDIADFHPRVAHNLARLCHALGQRCGAMRL